MEAGIVNRNAPLSSELLLNAYFQIIRLHLTTEERLSALEDTLNVTLPADYTSFLSHHRSMSNTGFIVATGTGYWEVNTLFEVAEGPIHLQIDSVYSTVSDTLPSGLLPIAKNSRHDFYCLVTKGENKGKVVFVNREHASDKQHAEDVAPSFTAFLQGLRH